MPNKNINIYGKTKITIKREKREEREWVRGGRRIQQRHKTNNYNNKTATTTKPLIRYYFTNYLESNWFCLSTHELTSHSNSIAYTNWERKYTTPTVLNELAWATRTSQFSCQSHTLRMQWVQQSAVHRTLIKVDAYNALKEYVLTFGQLKLRMSRLWLL